MKPFGLVAACVGLVLAATSCTMQQKNVQQELQYYPINCSMAEGEIRSLQHEKTHVQQQIEAGISAIVPIGAVVGVVSGTEGENYTVATGEYNKMIDAKIAEIKTKCRIR